MELLLRVPTAGRQIDFGVATTSAECAAYWLTDELAPLVSQAIARYEHESTRNDSESATAR